MKQKVVSFKVAKAIKEAGYPQDKFNNVQYYTKSGHLSYLYQYGVPYYEVDCFAPTYLDMWLWLWQEKNLRIEIIDCDITTQCYATINNSRDTMLFNSPEEAIIAAINYLVDNNLIK